MRTTELLEQHLAHLSDVEFEHVYEMPKRAACVKFQVEAYTVGFWDAFAGRPEENAFLSALNRKHYEMGYRAGAAKRALLPPI